MEKQNDDFEFIDDVPEINNEFVKPIDLAVTSVNENTALKEDIEVIDIEESLNNKPNIIAEQIITKEIKEKSQTKSGIILVIFILLLITLIIIFLPQISNMLNK
ncbi:MAG: hypothetical protein RRY16_01085 [Bacilli bacterium]